MNEIITIPAWDGYFLSSTHFIPENQNGRIILIINDAGENQKRYHRFATFLSSQGYDAYTFDFRGTGHSRQGAVRKSKADLTDWALLDLDAMISHLSTAYKSQKLIIVAHGIGGVLAGLSRMSKRADAVLFIGCQSPYFKNLKGFISRARYSITANVLVPFFNNTIGYFPSSWFGFAEDLPREVAAQLIDWTRSPRAVINAGESPDAGFKSMEQRTLSISFSDDQIATAVAADEFISLFKNIRSERWHFSPEQVVQRNVGHSGFFKKSMKTVVWGDVVAWINAAVSGSRNKAA
jgi:predicted alpha/beta hydrolase